jgi:GMP synthase-like glutamine amidotransferase
MRLPYLQHVPFEGLDSIEHWLRRTGAEITRTRCFDAWELPDPNVIDLLIVMGGPMRANDETEFTWLSAEKAFIRDMVASGNAVLGVCLGAQLIANAMGAAVYPNAVKRHRHG